MSLTSEDARRLTEATQQLSVATIVAAIIAASGKGWSVEEAMKLHRDIRLALYPRH